MKLSWGKDRIYLSLLLVLVFIGSVYYIYQALAYYRNFPLPSGDALEYMQFAEVLYTGERSSNYFLDRWPGFPLILFSVWKIAGFHVIWQYLVNIVGFLAIPVIVSYWGYKNQGWPLALACLVILSMQPFVIDNSIRGMTETLYSLLLVLVLLIGKVLPRKPLTLLLPLAITICFLVLFREEGRYMALYALLIFMVVYFRRGIISLRVVAVILVCVVLAYLSLNYYSHYLENHSIIPIRFRGGCYLFYKSFLQNKIAYQDPVRAFAHITYTDWISLYQVSSLPGMALESYSRIWQYFDIMVFPSSFLLLLFGLFWAFKQGYRIEVLGVLPLIGFYTFTFHLSTQLRYLIPFFYTAVPLGICGITTLASKLSNKRSRLIKGSVPLVFAFLCVANWYLINTEKIPVERSYKDSPQAYDLQKRAKSMLTKGEFDGVLEITETALERYQDWIFFHLAAGLSYYAEGNKEKAFDHIDWAMELSPYIAESHYVGYYLYGREGNTERAIRIIEEFLSYRPEFRPTRDLVKSLYLQLAIEDKSLTPIDESHFKHYNRHLGLRYLSLNSFNYWVIILNKHFPTNFLHLSEINY